MRQIRQSSYAFVSLLRSQVIIIGRRIGVDMTEFIKLCAGFVAAVFRSRASLQTENLALRHQLCVYQQSVKRPKVKSADRILWSLLAKA